MAIVTSNIPLVISFFAVLAICYIAGYAIAERKHNLDKRFITDILYGNIHPTKKLKILKQYFKEEK